MQQGKAALTPHQPIYFDRRVGRYPIANRALGDLRDVTAGDQRLGNLYHGK